MNISTFIFRSVPSPLKILTALILTIGLPQPNTSNAATLSVECNADSLIAAMQLGNASAEPFTIQLTQGCTYVLDEIEHTDPLLGSSGLPPITGELIINGNGATISSSSATESFRLIQVQEGAVLTINQLTLLRGHASNGVGLTEDVNGRDGGAIHNRGTLSLFDVILRENSAGGGSTNGPGGEIVGIGGDGGAIYNAGNATLIRTFVLENSSGSGSCGYACYGGSASGNGGAVFNLGNLTAIDSLFSENQTGRTLGSRYGGHPGSGGAIYNVGILNLSNCTFSLNKTGSGQGAWGAPPGGDGGAIFTNGVMQVTNSLFHWNETGSSAGNRFFSDPTGGGAGGAIYVAVDGKLLIQSSQFKGNRTGSGLSWSPDGNGGSGGDGGAIYDLGDLKIYDTLFEENATGDGGAAGYSTDHLHSGGHGGALFIGPVGTSEIHAAKVIRNRAGTGLSGTLAGGSGGNGGAVYNSGELGVSNTTFERNYAGNGAGTLEPLPELTGNAGEGGALYNSRVLIVNGSTFFKNRAGNGGLSTGYTPFAGNGGDGGGILNQGTATITNVTFYANRIGVPPDEIPYARPGRGGAIANRYGTLTARHVTFYRNGADKSAPTRGGAVYSTKGKVFLANSIVASSRNSANCAGKIQDLGGNLRFPKTDPSCFGVQRNPRLGPLQDNGGPTQTMLPGKTSAAIDAALDEQCPPTDQRGIARPQGGICDIGAVELP